MDLFLLGLLAMAACEKKPKKKGKKVYRSRRKDDSWLDYAWFHDHGHRV